MTIGNIAFIDWAGVNYFDLSEYRSDLEGWVEEAHWDAFEATMTSPCLPSFKISNRLNRENSLRQELESGLMPLQVKLDLREGFYPYLDRVEYQRNNHGGFSWETLPGSSLSDMGHTHHPLFRIIERLANETGHIVKAEAICTSAFRNWEDISALPHYNVSVMFYVSEDIRQPTRYLQALAAKMTRWAMVI